MADDDMTPRAWSHATTGEVLAGLEGALRRWENELPAVLKAMGEPVKDAEQRLAEIRDALVLADLDDDQDEDRRVMQGRLERYVRRAKEQLSDMWMIWHALQADLATAANHAMDLEELLAPAADDAVGAADD